jgi:hypothetical protein
MAPRLCGFFTFSRSTIAAGRVAGSDSSQFTNSATRKIVGLEGYGLRVVGTRLVGSKFEA